MQYWDQTPELAPLSPLPSKEMAQVERKALRPDAGREQDCLGVAGSSVQT